MLTDPVAEGLRLMQADKPPSKNKEFAKYSQMAKELEAKLAKKQELL